MADTMEIIRLGRKGKYSNTLEKYHIYKVSKDNLIMNDTQWYTQFIIRYISQNLHKATVQQSPLFSPQPSPPRYIINAETSTPHKHNIYYSDDNTIHWWSERRKDGASE
jgi:hypothetical protein